MASNMMVYGLSLIGRIGLIFLSVMMAQRCYEAYIGTSKQIFLDMEKQFPDYPWRIFAFQDEEGLVLHDRYLLSPFSTSIHFICGFLFMVISPFQFIPAIRKHLPLIHKLSGYIFLISSTVLTLSAVFFASIFGNVAFAGVGWDFGIFLLGLTFGFSGLMAFKEARNRKFQAHREWMIRHVCFGYSIALMRPLMMGLAVFGENSRMQKSTLFEAEESRGYITGTGWMSIFIMYLISDVWINLTRDTEKKFVR